MNTVAATTITDSKGRIPRRYPHNADISPLPSARLVRLLGVVQTRPFGTTVWGAMEKPTSGELYERHAPGALRFAYLLTGDLDLAHDLVQDAFVKLLARPRILSREDAFESYLRTTIVNLTRSRWRRLALERRHATARRIGSSQADDHFEERDAMKAKLLSLPERQRTAVALRYFEDLSEAETAEVMNTSVAAVKSLVQRAMAALRSQIGDER